MARYIGVDLHRNCSTVSTRSETGKSSPREWRLNELAGFVKGLTAGDEVAVQLAGASRLFHDAVDRERVLGQVHSARRDHVADLALEGRARLHQFVAGLGR